MFGGLGGRRVVENDQAIDGNADLLRSCATDPSMYFEVTDSSQLVGVFNAIGTTIANPHLAR